MTGLSDACQPYRESFSDLIEGEMDGVDAKRIESHLQECSNCRKEMVVLQGVVKTLGAIPEEEVPGELSRAIMARVKTDPLWLRVWRFLEEPFGSMPVRIMGPAVALCLLFYGVRTYVPIEIRFESRSSGGEIASISPVWWGGTLYVNDKALAPTQSGRIALRPGDSVKTSENTQLHLAYGEANVEVISRASLIIKNDGLFLANGRITAQIDDSRAKIRPGTTFKVTTPVASIVHLGTTFTVSHIHDVTNVSVQSGVVQVNALHTDSKGELRAGDHMSIDADGNQVTPTANANASARNPAEHSEEVPLTGHSTNNPR